MYIWENQTPNTMEYYKVFKIYGIEIFKIPSNNFILDNLVEIDDDFYCQFGLDIYYENVDDEFGRLIIKDSLKKVFNIGTNINGSSYKSSYVIDLYSIHISDINSINACIALVTNHLNNYAKLLNADIELLESKMIEEMLYYIESL